MTDYYKYPRTFHSLLSETVTSDDKYLLNYDNFIGKEIVITEKMDGSNVTLYNDYYHNRSINTSLHSAFDWIKRYHSNLSYNIPSNLRICGEYLLNVHSISYEDLESYFLAFSVWDNDTNVCLSFDETKEWLDLLNICHVPILYEGIFDIKIIETLYKKLDKSKHEGIVVRLKESFHYDTFNNSVFKLVRANHVQTDKHWMHSQMKINKLKNKNDNTI